MSPDRVNERRRCVAWLHARADSMNDEHARQILHSAATNLGWTKGKPLPNAADKSEAEAKEEAKRHASEDWLDSIYAKALDRAVIGPDALSNRERIVAFLETQGAMLPEERARSRAQGAKP